MKWLFSLRFFASLIFFSLIFSACGGAQPAQSTPTNSNLPTDSSTAVPIDLAGPQLGSSMVWVDNSILVYIPGGEFTMGTNGEDNPQHKVSLSKFWIYRTEVTNRMYALCVANGQCTNPQDKLATDDLNKLTLRENPVVGVNWQQASDYCSWVRGRLPTEAEWELTARGPQDNIFPWGDSAATCDLTNFKDCHGTSSRVYDNPSGKSYYDVLDLAGNVYEWVGDYYRTKYYLTSPTQDPPGPDTGTNRVVRGGSFGSDMINLASAKRSNYDPTRTRPDLGFRCVVQNPVLYPPFCQASPFNGKIDQKNVTPSGGSCELLARFRGNDCGTVTADLLGGKVTSVSASTFACSKASDTRVFCKGPGSSKDSVTICGICNKSDSGGLNSVDNLSACSGAFAALANSFGSSAQCNYQGGPSQNGCPSGMIQNTDGTCSEPIGGISRCPVGTYLNTNHVCTSVNKLEGSCIAGFTYDAQTGCCKGASYPGCAQGEIETAFGCIQAHPSTGTSEKSCVTLTLDTGKCSNGPQGPGTCPPVGSGKYPCSTWDSNTCSWNDSCG